MPALRRGRRVIRPLAEVARADLVRAAAVVDEDELAFRAGAIGEIDRAVVAGKQVAKTVDVKLIEHVNAHAGQVEVGNDMECGRVDLRESPAAIRGYIVHWD